MTYPSFKDDAHELIDSMNEAMGRRFWPDELHHRMFYPMFELALASIHVQAALKEGIFEDSPELAEVISKIGAVSIQAGRMVKEKIPLRAFDNLERQYEMSLLKPLRPEPLAEMSTEEVGEVLVEGAETVNNPWGLSQEELAILMKLPYGRPQVEMAREQGLTIDKFKVQLGKILQRIDANSLHEARLIAYETYIHKFQQVLGLQPERYSSLLKSEREILGLMSDGLTYKDISALRCTLVSTTKAQATKIYRKLGINGSQTGIFLFEAKAAGLVEEQESSTPENTASPRSDERKIGGRIKGNDELDEQTTVNLRKLEGGKILDISTPGDEWRVAFENKFRQTMRLFRDKSIGDAARARIIELLQEAGVEPVNGDDPDQDHKNLAVVMLLQNPQIKRLLTHKRTSSVAAEVISAYHEAA